MARIRTGLALASAVAAITMLGAPAAAQPSVEVVAEGLNAPRHLTLDHDGSITWSSRRGQAVTNAWAQERRPHARVARGGERIVDGEATPVASGLLSAALSGGAEIVGPSDVAVAADGTLYVTI